MNVDQEKWSVRRATLAYCYRQEWLVFGERAQKKPWLLRT